MPPNTPPPTISPGNAIDDFFAGLEELLEETPETFEQFSDSVNELIAGLFP
jgi:hypothetical protein